MEKEMNKRIVVAKKVRKKVVRKKELQKKPHKKNTICVSILAWENFLAKKDANAKNIGRD
jgi:hypothetical protein